MSTCMQILAPVSKMTFSSHTLMNDRRCSSSTATSAFLVFLPLNFSGICKGSFFEQLTSMCPFNPQTLHVQVSFFLPLLSFPFELPFPFHLTLSSTFDKVVSSSLLAFSSPFSFPPLIRHCFHILSTMCFAVHVTFLLFLHI